MDARADSPLDELAGKGGEIAPLGWREGAILEPVNAVA